MATMSCWDDELTATRTKEMKWWCRRDGGRVRVGGGAAEELAVAGRAKESRGQTHARRKGERNSD
ncbi:uncharacterized protein J3R85_000789 [Psidium guajava]|nr:uncharacterized protein J3R85_000789 [Psidium guajava]